MGGCTLSVVATVASTVSCRTAKDHRRVYLPETSPAQPPDPSTPTLRVPAHADPSSVPAHAGSADTVEQWVSAQLHRDALERYLPRGARVLELSTVSARLTEVIHRLGCKLSVQAASVDELELLRARARERGFEGSVERWVAGSMVNLEAFADGSFDAVVAYGGALGYALERRDRALTECMRVLAPRGLLILAVFSLWGSMHRHLPFVLARDLVDNRAVIRSGNVLAPPSGAAIGADAASALLGGGRPCHLFRAAELEAFLRRGGLELLSLSASSALSTGLDRPVGGDPSAWSPLLEYERAACIERGYLDSGTQLIAVARR